MGKKIDWKGQIRYKYKVGDRAIIMFGDPYFDYHSPKNMIDLRPDLVGRMGKVVNIMNSYSQPSYKLDIAPMWFAESRIRRLTIIERIRLWWK